MSPRPRQRQGIGRPPLAVALLLAVAGPASAAGVEAEVSGVPAGAPAALDIGTTVHFDLTREATLSILADKELRGLTTSSSGSTLTVNNNDRAVPLSAVMGSTASTFVGISVSGDRVGFAASGDGTPSEPGLFGVPIDILLTGVFAMPTVDLECEVEGATGPGRARLFSGDPTAISRADGLSAPYSDTASVGVDAVTGVAERRCLALLRLDTTMDFSVPVAATYIITATAPP